MRGFQKRGKMFLYLLKKHRSGARIGHDTAYDHMFLDGLEDAYEEGRAMGTFAQDTANEYQLTREEMDNYSIESLRRANAAIDSGAFADEANARIAALAERSAVAGPVDPDARVRLALDGPLCEVEPRVQLGSRHQILCAAVRNGVAQTLNGRIVTDDLNGSTPATENGAAAVPASVDLPVHPAEGEFAELDLLRAAAEARQDGAVVRQDVDCVN